MFYAHQKHIQSTSSNVANSIEVDVYDILNDSDYSKTYVKGWARKIRTVRKITPKQKEFIENLFKNGAQSKTKLSAEQMSELMKEEMVDGSYYFSPDEYLEPKRIRSLITTLKKKESGKKPTASQNLSEGDGIEQNLEEICNSVLDSDDEEDFLGFDKHDI